MKPNPVLKKLGFSKNERVVIIHTDDIGMCQASVAAFEELWDFGLISSGATMVVCPWFPAVASLCRKKPTIDLGVHITITSEWDSYRWGPISNRDPNSGLLDDEGYFYRSSEDAQENGAPEYVALEMRAQVDRAIQAGIDLTHVDTHMGAVASMEFIPDYLSFITRYQLPVMMMRLDKAGWMGMGFDEDTADLAVQMVNELEEKGVPLIDQIGGLELDRARTVEERLEYAKQEFGRLKTGITHFIIHPSKDTPELRAITTDWACRSADFQAFKDDSLRDYLNDQGVQIIGYKQIKSLMHNKS